MYVTKPLSLYYNTPNAVTEPPPEGPGSGTLVIEDKEAEEQATCCWGMVWTSRLYDTPFPQDRMIKVRYGDTPPDLEKSRHTYRDDAYFIPVIGQPLSSNRYYVVRAHGRHKGKTCTCSKEEDVSTFCLCTFVKDIEPTQFDHRDIYQQVEVIPRKNRFRAVSVASDGIPRRFLRRKGWQAYSSKPTHYSLGEALGMDTALRMRMPDLDFPILTKYSSPVVVGKWYCPYIFVKEGDQLRDQMKRSMFYEMTLEQYWEEIHTRENYYGEERAVEVGVSVKREMALLTGGEAVNDNLEIVEGVIWFRPDRYSPGNGLGLSLPIWERMRWEEARGGWTGGEKVERVERVEMYEGKSGWRRFGCYVLVERFVLKRMDGSLAITYEFKHTDKIRIKWE